MKTIFDLRKNSDASTIKKIESFFNQSLKTVHLSEGAIKSCIGCWNCWLKTPGRCVMNDLMSSIYPDYVNSESVIILMDTAMGFVDYNAKAFLDRTIPHYHPYIEIVDGECHHLARYERYPDMYFYFDTKDVTEYEAQVIEDYLYRTAYHYQSNAFRIDIDDELKCTALTFRPAKNRHVRGSNVEKIDRLIIYNGSPRQKGSNSELILNKVKERLGDKVEIRDLKKTENWANWASSFSTDENVMFFMPLYVHAMPSHVMDFIEKLSPSHGSISFFIQSGFPESSQSHYLEAYFEQLSIRLKRTYLGTAIKGGVEGLQIRPVKAQDNMIQPMIEVIVDLVKIGTFNPEKLRTLANPVRLGKPMCFVFSILKTTGIVNFFWDQQLKSNHAFEKRFDRPWSNAHHTSNS